MDFRKDWTFWLPAALAGTALCLCVLALFSAPGEPGPWPIHLFGYAVSAALLVTACGIAASRNQSRLSVVIAAAGTAAGLTYWLLSRESEPQWLPPAGISLLWLSGYLGALLSARSGSALHLQQAIMEQSLPQAVVAADARIVYANQAFSELLAIPASALKGTDLCEFIDPDCWLALQQQAVAASSSGAPPLDELQEPTIDQFPVAVTDSKQQRRWALLHATRSNALPTELIMLSGWEQTESKALLTDRSHAASAYEQVIQVSHDIVLWLNAKGRIVGSNERAGLVLGKDIKGQSILQILALEEAGRFSKALQGCNKRDETATLRRLQLQPINGNKALQIDARLQPSSSGSAAMVLTGSSVNHWLTETRDLQRNTQVLESVLRTCPDAISIVRRDNRTIINVNDAFSRILGHSREEAVGQPEESVLVWERAEDHRNALNRLFKDGKDVETRTRLRHASGSYFNAQLTQRLIVVGEQECELSIIRDISEPLKAEAARAASEEKFLRTFENSPDGMAILRKEGAIIRDINPALLEASGYDVSHFLNRSLFETGVMADLNEMNLSNMLLKKEGHFENIEMSFRTINGDKIPALVSVKAFELEGEDHLLAVVRDVRELRKAEATVARIEERFRGAFENAQLAMILIDLDGRIFQTNRFAQDLLSYSSSDLNGMHISRLIPPEDKIKLKEALMQLTQGGEKRYRSERRMLCQNGLEIWTNFQIVLQQDPSGKDAYFFVQAADVTDIKLSQRRMERMAFYDTLTDLANRRLFQDRLQHAIEHCQRNARMSALLYLDLDQFKRVNDTLGHEAGDALLREVALRLTECVRTEDTVGRTGGDEFTVLLFDIANSGDAGTVAEKILESLREPIHLSGHNLVVTTSIGIATIPTDGRDANVVMKNADLAMYRAKERGRNNYQFFSEDMNTKAILRLRTENELREGLDRGEFVLHHQPKYRISDGQIIGVEALVRWNHPTRGLLSPGEFIQIAEETGAIVKLGTWVIEESCKAGKAFADIAGGEFTLAVNISPRQFRDPNLISHIRRCLRTSGLPANMLQIEITETMLMHDVEAASIIVERLHELGTFIAIDDFGTGYSSLNYLKKFPIQTIKVDRSFVTDIPSNSDDMAITAAVIAMAHRLNMDVVAEGVETLGQLKFLADNHCEYAQGYLFSKPLPFDDIEPLIRYKYSPHCRKLNDPPLEDQPLPRAPAERAVGKGREK